MSELKVEFNYWIFETCKIEFQVFLKGKGTTETHTHRASLSLRVPNTWTEKMSTFSTALKGRKTTEIYIVYWIILFYMVKKDYMK